MPMGVVSDSEFDSELSHSDSSVKPDIKKREESNSGFDSIDSVITGEAVIKDSNKGRGPGNVNVPNALRNMIGEESVINGRQNGVEMGRQFGISPSSVSAYSNGATSTASYDNQPNLGILNESKARVSKRARIKLMAALANITPDKLLNTKAVELASIAKSMSGVIKDMEPDTPKNPLGEKSGPTFVFYAPHFRKEDSYDIIDAKE